MNEKLPITLRKPLAVVSGAIASFVMLDPTWLLALGGTIWANAGTLFTGVSIFAFTVVPNVAELRHLKSVFLGMAVVLALIRGSKLLLGVYHDYEEEVDD